MCVWTFCAVSTRNKPGLCWLMMGIDTQRTCSEQVPNRDPLGVVVPPQRSTGEDEDDQHAVDPAINIRDASTWPEFLSTAEAAHVLRITITTMRSMIRSGEVPAREVGRGYLISKQWLLTHFADRS